MFGDVSFIAVCVNYSICCYIIISLNTIKRIKQYTLLSNSLNVALYIFICIRSYSIHISMMMMVMMMMVMVMVMMMVIMMMVMMIMMIMLMMMMMIMTIKVTIKYIYIYIYVSIHIGQNYFIRNIDNKTYEYDLLCIYPAQFINH